MAKPTVTTTGNPSDTTATTTGCTSVTDCTGPNEICVLSTGECITQIGYAESFCEYDLSVDCY